MSVETVTCVGIGVWIRAFDGTDVPMPSPLELVVCVSAAALWLEESWPIETRGVWCPLREWTGAADLGSGFAP